MRRTLWGLLVVFLTISAATAQTAKHSNVNEPNSASPKTGADLVDNIPACATLAKIFKDVSSHSFTEDLIAKYSLTGGSIKEAMSSCMSDPAVANNPLATEGASLLSAASLAAIFSEEFIVISDENWMPNVPACAAFVQDYDSMNGDMKAFTADPRRDNASEFLKKFLAALDNGYQKDQNSCMNSPELKNNGPMLFKFDYIAGQPYIVGEHAVEKLEETQLKDLTARYNELVDRYNTNLGYIQGALRGMAISNELHTIFVQPQPTDLHCTTSALGESLITNCN